MRLHDQLVVVTGAASGIGRQIAKECLQEGARVVAVDIDAERLQALQAEEGDRFWASVTDVTDAQAVTSLIGSVSSRWGSVTGLVHSAYWTNPQRLTETCLEDWQKTLEVTLTGAFLLSRAVIPEMLANGGGTIVPIASVHSLVAFPAYFAYQVAKAGLLGFVRSVATDYGPSIRCNAIAPGAIQTPALNDAPPAVRQRVESGALLKRVGSAHDVARAVLFLLSEDSAFMTGTTLVLDGGWTAV